MSAAAVWISPDCMEGKHRACNGEAWDAHADALASGDCVCDHAH